MTEYNVMNFRGPALGFKCVAAAALILGCADKPPVADSMAKILDHSGLPLVVLEPDTFSVATVIGQPSEVTLIGGHLWVSDRDGPPFLHVLDTATGQVVKSLGQKGQGPEDFNLILGVFSHSVADSSVWVADAEHGLRRMFVAGAEPEVLRNPPPVAVKGRRVAYVFPFGKGRFIAYNFSDTATFIIFDTAGTVLRVAGAGFVGPDSAARREKLMAINGSPLCPKRDGSGFVVAYHNFGRLDFYGADGIRTVRAKVPFPSEPHFVVDSSTKRLRFKRHRTQYAWCTFSDSHLFALYSGKRESEYPSDGFAAQEANFVHMFDAEGRLVKVFDLGVGVMAMTVDPPGRTLYAASWTTAAIYKFTLPE